MREGWTYKKLGELADFYRGLTYNKNDEVASSNVCVLRSNNIDLKSQTLVFDELKYLREDFEIPQDKKIKANSIFVCMSNGSKQHVGKVAFIDKDMDFAFGGFMGLVVPKDNVAAKYIYYICRSSIYRQFLLSIGNGIGITNLKFSDLRDFIVPIPTLQEQLQIVSELDLLSSVIEKQKAQIEDLDKLAQSIFYDMFGDPVENEKGWDVVPLNNNIEEMFLGPFGSSLKVDSYVSKEDSYCMVYEQKHAIQAKLDLENHYINKEKFDFLSRFEVKPGDYIMSCRGTIGKIFQIPQNAPRGIIHPSVMKIRLKGQLYESTYFMKMLKLIVANEVTNGNCVQMAITAKALGEKKLPLPPLSLQKKYEDIAQAIESMKAKVRQSLEESKMLFNSRMDYYFN